MNKLDCSFSVQPHIFAHEKLSRNFLKKEWKRLMKAKDEGRFQKLALKGMKVYEGH